MDLVSVGIKCHPFTVSAFKNISAQSLLYSVYVIHLTGCRSTAHRDINALNTFVSCNSPCEVKVQTAHAFISWSMHSCYLHYVFTLCYILHTSTCSSCSAALLSLAEYDSLVILQDIKYAQRWGGVTSGMSSIIIIYSIWAAAES